ncbi:hypothetical protein CPL00221_CDS0030 [Escherichia phage RobRod40]
MIQRLAKPIGLATVPSIKLPHRKQTTREMHK